MNNTTSEGGLDKLQAINANLFKLKQMQRILSYLEDAETIWTYAPLIIVAFGLIGKAHNLSFDTTSIKEDIPSIGQC